MRTAADGAVERRAQAGQLRVAADERLAVGGHGRDRDARRAAEPVERVAHRGGPLRAVLRALGEQAEHERVEVGRDAGRVARRRVRDAVAVLGEQHGGVAP